ncbi:DUF6417 family protein [Streptomyces sp. bgisy031]|uniref:DUF6417 family protein n=1 Tax=Streptomyces sp. bgisy031 TaxID=3413772 RepID=UPI003D75B4A1
MAELDAKPSAVATRGAARRVQGCGHVRAGARAARPDALGSGGRYLGHELGCHQHDPCAAQESTARRLAMLTLDQAHNLIRLLQLIASEGLDELSEEADCFARAIAARIPSVN